MQLFNRKLLTFFNRTMFLECALVRKTALLEKRLKNRKRFLLGSMKNLYEKFCESTTTYKMSYSTFCKLKPFWVVAPKVTDIETCACNTHANAQFLVEAMYRAGTIDR